MRTKIIKINSQSPEDDKISFCAKILKGGGLVAFPTETVYGLGANMRNRRAMERLYRVKESRGSKPFSLHIAQKEEIEEFVMDLTPTVYKLIDKFWPGPLTLILPAKEGGSIGVRMPKNPIALRLLYEADVPVVAPSANLSGNPAPKNIDEVLKDLNGLIDAAIDGGETELGLESTVLDLTVSPAEFLRKGAISQEKIEKVLKTKQVLFVCTGNSCRSVMAEALLKKMLGNRDDVEVSSAGTNAAVGMHPTSLTHMLLSEQGIDISEKTSNSVSELLLKKSDLILVMEKSQEEKILAKFPSAKSHLFILKEFAGMTESSLEIPDPIGSSEEVYREVFNTIQEAIERVVKLI